LSESEAESTLLAMLDERQDEVLEGLDQLNERVVETINNWTVSSS